MSSFPSSYQNPSNLGSLSQMNFDFLTDSSYLNGTLFSPDTHGQPSKDSKPTGGLPLVDPDHTRGASSTPADTINLIHHLLISKVQHDGRIIDGLVKKLKELMELIAQMAGRLEQVPTKQELAKAFGNPTG